MTVSKTAIEIREALIFLENTAGHRKPVLHVVMSGTYALKTDFIKITKYESSDV